MQNFWDFEVWKFIGIVAVLGIGLLVANLLKKSLKFLRYSLIPTSVLGGLILLAISGIYRVVNGVYIFDTEFFCNSGSTTLEMITYHCLALGFIAMTLKSSSNKLNKLRGAEIFNTGVTTVSTYLLQGLLGLAITIGFATVIPKLIPAAGIILPFGFGQGTGQAMNYGNIYEVDYGFSGGKNFGLTIAAIGFLSASLGGVIHLNILRARGRATFVDDESGSDLSINDIQTEEEIPMNGGIDKFTIQIAAILGVYFITYLVIFLLGDLVSSFRSVIYGFNFLFGVLFASLTKLVLNLLRRKKVVKKVYLNNFLLDRISSFFFDLMIVAGIAAIKIELLGEYWYVVLILSLVGGFSTYFYNLFIAKKLFKRYSEEQFLAMYGMLTGTASTGIMLLRELDADMKTPASENLVYQNFPAMVFGFPLMLLAALAPKQPVMTLIILAIFFVIMNIILFRRFIFRRRRKKK